MTPADDDILITESRNLSDDSTSTNGDATKESDIASIRALEKQGIFLEKDGEKPTTAEPRDELSKELEDMGGIEIIQNGDKEV